MKDQELRQRSKEFGIKLAKALRGRAIEERRSGLDPRYIMLGAAEYLRETAEFQINPPLDDSAVDPEDQRN